MSTIDVQGTALRHRFTLANGLRVVVEEDHTTPAVAINLWYGVGSRHETAGRTGLAHLFEHLMFQGSQNVAAGEHFALLDALGADLNATTSSDRTNYFEVVPLEGLDLALWLEADRLGGLLAALDQKNLDTQRDVVRNERRQHLDNRPYGTSFERLFAATFPEGHQYHHQPIGSMADLAAATLDDVRDFFIRHYSPANASLSLVGDIDPEDALRRVERYFGGIAPTPLPPTLAPQDFSTPGNRIHVDDEQVPAPMVYMLWASPSDGTAAANHLDLATPLLAGADSSRLRTELVRRRQLATFVSAGQERLIGGRSAYYLVARGHEGVDPRHLADERGSLITDVGADAPTPLEMDIARAQRETSFLSERETLAGRADSLSHGLSLFDDPGYDDGVLAATLATTPEDVTRAVRDHLSPQDATILTYTPATESNGASTR